MPQKIIIPNNRPWRDTQGRIIDAHEPDLRFFEGRFWLYGTRFGELSGFTDEHRIGVYSSPDLLEWTDHGALTPHFPARLQADACVIFNERTRKYVLWLKATGREGEPVPQGFAVLTADQPAGPFTLARESTRTHFPRAGDQNLFVDDDGTAYRVSDTTLDNRDPQKRHLVHVERLSDDYLEGTGEISEILCLNCEGNAMFKRNGLYYVLTDNTCTFCAAGSGARVYTAESPLGPYNYRGNINRQGGKDPRSIASEDFDTAWGAGRGDVIVKGQQRCVARIETADAPAYVWVADRWQTAEDGVKGHDYLYTYPLDFAEDGMPQSIEWIDSWTLTLPTKPGGS